MLPLRTLPARRRRQRAGPGRRRRRGDRRGRRQRRRQRRRGARGSPPGTAGSGCSRTRRTRATSRRTTKGSPWPPASSWSCCRPTTSSSPGRWHVRQLSSSTTRASAWSTGTRPRSPTPCRLTSTSSRAAGRRGAATDWLASMCRRAKNPVYTPGVVMRRDGLGGGRPVRRRVPAGADMLSVVPRGGPLGHRPGEQRRLRPSTACTAPTCTSPSTTACSPTSASSGKWCGCCSTSRLRAAPPRRCAVAAHRSLARRASRLALAEVRDSGDDEAAQAYRSFADETLARIGGRAPRRAGSAVPTSGWRPARPGWCRRIERHLGVARCGGGTGRDRAGRSCGRGCGPGCCGAP